jgi:hypothetical protein
VRRHPTRYFGGLCPAPWRRWLLPMPDESSATVQWFYEDAGDHVC